MKVKIWKIDGYRGFDDYDGREDDNFHETVAVDSRLSQLEVEEIFYAKYRNHRVKVFHAELQSEVCIGEE